MFSPQINKISISINSTANPTFTFQKNAVVVAQLRSRNIISIGNPSSGVCFKHQLTSNTLYNTANTNGLENDNTGYARLFPSMASGCCYVTQGQVFEFYKYGSSSNYLELDLFIFEVE